jgi:predicted acyltransferase (DUF342 family)
MAFFLFTLFFCAVFYMHFSMAHRAWRQIRGKQSAELDMGYVRLEDYFSQSFRTKLAGWVKTLPRATNSSTGLRVFDKGNERIFVAGGAKYPAGRKEREILVIEGDFDCGQDCEFEKELMVKGNCTIGKDSQLQALAVDGTLHVGEGVQVRRWVDAVKQLTIGGDAVVASRVTSRTAIEFQPGAQALSLFAPEVFTEGRHESDLQIEMAPPVIVQLPHLNKSSRVEHGYDPEKLFGMGANTYLYNGDLHLSAPLHLRASFVVRGDFSCPKESLLEGDLKAHGSVSIGAASVVKGNLVAGTDLTLKPNTYFQGLLHAGGTLRLSRGVRGLRDKLPVAAYAAGVLTVESNVVVNGKLASAERVVAISTPVAWLERPGRGAVSE